MYNSTLISLPAPANLSYMWNMGSLLGLCLGLQLITGLLLASAYSVSMNTSFTLMAFLMETMDKGWLIRYLHANGASLFFLCLYLHAGRGIYYSSFLQVHTWNIGVTILLLTMATAFMGYVLPLNQMSFWGASVITNLFSEIPYIGPDLIKILWGDMSVNEPTVMRFFTFHFVLPFVILALAVIHITLLHQEGSSNPLGILSNTDKIPFHSYFSMKDLVGVMFTAMVTLTVSLLIPLVLGDDENFTPADPSTTPIHIQPEWYFLFAYAILRSIPNKLGGVLGLLLSILLLYILPLTATAKMKGTALYPVNKLMFWGFISCLIILTWLGACPVEPPFLFLSQMFTALYFLYFLVNPLVSTLWDYIIK
uniref:Cytochrome b n=1 Tax=Bactrurus brachycaudus TaxID=111554 RepID=A0A6C0X4V5_9CRUS|nr:cytochrome b [Bactrurus brachycaudus]QIC54390.1 cytochrome b [Bactrurus brachycaudus]